MGYDGQILLMKRKAIEKAKILFPNDSFSEIYNMYLFTREYPKEYEFEEDEKTIDIVYFNHNIFQEYFQDNTLENEEARIIDEKTYEEFKKWIENKVKTITLLDIVNKTVSEAVAVIYINIYLALKDLKIDRNTECIVFQHDY